MGRIINLQVPLNEYGTMTFSVKELQHIMNAYKELFPNDEIIASPMRLEPADEQLNIELFRSIAKESTEMYRNHLLMEFCRQCGVDNWHGFEMAQDMYSHYMLYGTMENYQDRYSPL